MGTGEGDVGDVRITEFLIGWWAHLNNWKPRLHGHWNPKAVGCDKIGIKTCDVLGSIKNLAAEML